MITYKLVLKSPDYITPVTSYDVSDYVEQCGQVPYKTRNEDWSLIAEGYTCIISSSCPYTPLERMMAYMYRGTTCVHIGIVNSVNLVEEENQYEVKIDHILIILKDKDTKLSHWAPYFINALYNNGEVRTTWNSPYTFVTAQGLAKTIIEELRGWEKMDLDSSNTRFFESKYYAWWGVYRHDPADSDLYYDEISPTVTEADILFLPEELNCTGEPDVHNPSDLTDDPTTVQISDSRRIKLWDMLSLLFSIMGWYLIVKDEGTFYLCNERDYVPGTVGSGTFLTLSNFFAVEDKIVKAKREGLTVTYRNLDLRFHLMPGAPYYINSYAVMPHDHDVTITYTGGRAQKSLTWMNHFNPIVHVLGLSEHIIYPALEDAKLENSCMWYQARPQLYSMVQYKRTVYAADVLDAATLYEFTEILLDPERDEAEIKYSKVIG